MYTKKPFSPIPPTAPAVTPKRRRFILAIGLVPIAPSLEPATARRKDDTA